MRKFVFLILFVLGFAVCYAAPPPEPFEQLPVFTEQIAVDQSIDLPSVTPCIALQDQQPAPLLNVMLVNRIAIRLVAEESSKMLPTSFIYNDNYNLERSIILQDKRASTLIYTHSSGGMPY